MGFEVLQTDLFGQACAYLDTRQPDGIVFELITFLGNQNVSMPRGRLAGA